MKRTPFKRKPPSKKVKPRSKLRKQGTSDVSKAKRRIQALLRQKAIERDTECVVGKYPHLLGSKWINCGPHRGDGEVVVQAEHLVERSNAKTYGDMENIVLVCMRHHFYLKSQNKSLYWMIIEKHLGAERWEKIKQWEREYSTHQTNRMYLSDWLRIEEELTNKQSKVYGSSY